MKHLCNCGEIVNAEGDVLKIATCKNCGTYYIYAHEIVPPYSEDESLLKDIHSKVHSTHNVVVEEDARPFIKEEIKELPITDEPTKVKPRQAKRR